MPKTRRWRPPLRRLRRTTLTLTVALTGLAILLLGPAAIAVAVHLSVRHEDVPAGQRYLGDPVQAGPAVFVVHELRCGEDRENSLNGRVCEVAVSVHNLGDEALTVPAQALVLYGPGSVRFLPAGGEAEPFGTLEPGDSATARIGFDVPPQAEITHVGVRPDVYADSVPVAVTGAPLPLRSPGD
ncbi:MAG TPA: DUF4352 domain-containing protein [Natronosporangium sp.]|nr:DUF4352 domain-containing protein [Natronosporangium sp.]